MTPQEKLKEIKAGLENYDHVDSNWAEENLKWLVSRTEELEDGVKHVARELSKLFS